MRDPVFLIVDDEEDILALTRVLCNDLACMLHTATSGEKALELAESLDTLDVIVADPRVLPLCPSRRSAPSGRSRSAPG